MERFGLRDDQWDRIKDFLPGRDGHVGGTAADNQLFVNAVLYRYRTGIPWRDLPARFGDWKVTHSVLVDGRGSEFLSAFSRCWLAIMTTNT
jgi:transposase